MEILLALVAKLAPYAIAAGSLFGLYFYIKGKGRAEVRKEVEAEQLKEQVEINTRLQDAERQDQAIDSAAQKTIAERIEALKQKQQASSPDRFKF